MNSLKGKQNLMFLHRNHPWEWALTMVQRDSIWTFTKTVLSVGKKVGRSRITSNSLPNICSRWIKCSFYRKYHTSKYLMYVDLFITLCYLNPNHKSPKMPQCFVIIFIQFCSMSNIQHEETNLETRRSFKRKDFINGKDIKERQH